MLKCSYKNPLRVPDWKWQRVVGIIENQQPPSTITRDTKEGKNWIAKALRFKQRYEECESDLDKLVLADTSADIFWAYDIWLSGASTRWDIEAHILANCDNEYIANYCAIDLDVVEAYVQLFFDVREKLNNRGYILHAVFKDSIHRGLKYRDYDTLWKLFGYCYGPHVLESLTSKTINPRWCNSPDAAGAAFEEDIKASIKLSSALAAKTYILNQDTQADLLGLYTKLVELEREAGMAGAGESQLMTHIEAMFTTLPFAVGGRDPNNNHQKLEKSATLNVNDAVELRYDEELKLLGCQDLDFEKMVEANKLETQKLE